MKESDFSMTFVEHEARRILQPEILLEEYRRILEDPRVESLPLVISGNSMSPFLIHGRDTVYLSRIERPVRRGDVILYRRDNGAYILHRVYAVEAPGRDAAGQASDAAGFSGVADASGAPAPVRYTMVGDAQSVLEPGIRRDQMIAIMTAADRKGRRQEPGSFWWEFFEKVWIRMVPVRQLVRAVYERLRRIVKRAER